MTAKPCPFCGGTELHVVEGSTRRARARCGATGAAWRGGRTRSRTLHRATLARASLDDLRWHDLRGTAATRMLAAGATDGPENGLETIPKAGAKPLSLGR